jgi:glycosyltransferase involved in cell wall biosynthesis
VLHNRTKIIIEKLKPMTMENPNWLYEHLFDYSYFDEIPQSVFDSINAALDRVQSKEPLVTVAVCALNEEVNILKTISSLSRMSTQYPFEIIVINNNSNDNTQMTLDKLHVKSYFQPILGWGPARQLGIEKAAGKYVLMADSDAIYPELWLDKMVNELEQPGVACVYGRYSFIAEEGFPRWQLFIHEKLKDFIAELRHFKRPYLNAYGLSMGFIKEYALKEGYVMHLIRGEDGRMCFDLMRYGKVKQVKSPEARVWTYPRTLRREGSLKQAIFNRIVKEIRRIPSMFYSMRPHNTKVSTNDD